MKKIMALLLVSGAMVACSSNKAPDSDMKAVASAPEPVMASAPVIASAPEPVITNHNSVYFGFNQYDIKNDYTGIIQANANYLAGAKEAKLQIQGNTDDIGSVEYNLSLGQKRADAVKKALIANGAAKSQLEAVSNGKLKPKYDNNSSATRAMNRRSDMIYTNGQPSGYASDSNGIPTVDGSLYNGTVTEGIE